MSVKIKLLELRRRWWAGKAKSRWEHYQHWKQQGDRAHYWLKINEARHHPAAVKSDKEQIAKLSPIVHKWQGKWEKAHHEVHRYAVAIDKARPKPPPMPTGAGSSVPQTAWNPYRHKIANWIIPEIYDAVAHGARGHVTSGERTYATQKYLWELYKYHGGNIAAYPGTSNHEGNVYPRGAIDWSDPESLHRALVAKKSHRLIWAETVGLRDTVHFSGTGR